MIQLALGPWRRPPIIIIANIVCVLSIVAGTTACRPAYTGYGVLLWPSNSDVQQPGSLTGIVSESEIRETYIYSSLESEDEYETPRWRIAFFKDKTEAEEYAGRYEPWIDYFAIVERDGLAVREEPNVESQRLYKLRLDQKIKILDRVAEESLVGDHQGYWYRVLTDDGTIGYCFDYYIRVFDASKETGETPEKDTSITDLLLSRTYRPEYFFDMVKKRRIDLRRFREDIGLTIDPEQQIIRLVTEDTHLVYKYSSMKVQGEDRVVFSDSSVQVTILSGSQINVTYSTAGNTRYERFVYIEDVGGIIEAERRRRDEEYERFREAGPTLSSSFYGTLEFKENRRFSWTGKSRLVPDILSNTAGNSGLVEFPYFLGDDLRPQHEGVITFFFANLVPEEVSFLYSMTPSGLRLVYLPKKAPDNRIAVREVATPLVISFSSMEE